MRAALTFGFAALCAIAAGLQYNDPDPLRWIALYLGGGVAAVVVLVRPARWIVAVAVAALAALWATALWWEVAADVAVSDLWRKMSDKGGKVEQMREAGGLTIVAVACAWAAIAARRRRHR
jgi:Transmembrane family 220, helix